MTPRFNGTVCQAEEPFADRQERARTLPREYAAAHVGWIRNLMDAEAGVAYFSFSWWTKAPCGRNFRQMAERLQRACQEATCDHFPMLNRSSLNRIPPHLCVSAIMLPAEKQDGVRHAHGFLRAPVAALSAPSAVTVVQTHGTDVTIRAPQVIAGLVRHLRQSVNGGPTSLHIDHHDGYAINVAADRDSREKTFTYLTAAGPEVRSWDRLEWVPGPVWRRLTAQ